MRINDIRSAFLAFFEKNHHALLPSSPLVPQHDPSLLFTNAGMVQFKDWFTGQEKPKMLRVATAQKCVRAGGKHNDLDNVGYTARHHTFFEMMGNFSFGGYFKEEAIRLAWEFVHRTLGLPKEKLWITIYDQDTEAGELWKKIAGLSSDRLIPIGTKDNFWSMGETGPCGPCTEIFYDHGPSVPGGPPGSPEAEGDRFVEIWNLVFMQFEQRADGSRVPLPSFCVDTGMGLERLAAVLQGVTNNYETDLFQGLIHSLMDVLPHSSSTPSHASYRVIADHMRAIGFLIADGVLPSPEGRGYVLRRLMRRALRHAHLLGAKDPVLYRTTEALVKQMGQAYPELTRAQSLITQTLYAEENRFLQTLERGLHLLEDETAALPEKAPLSGSVAFKLYDTYGFPLDLTLDVLRGQNRGLDHKGFEDAMSLQKQKARQAWSGSGEGRAASLWYELKDAQGPTEFLGYQSLTAESVIVALVDGHSQPLSQGIQGEVCYFVVPQTPFYATSGGQEGDQGEWQTSSGARVRIEETFSPLSGITVHRGKVMEGTIALGDRVVMTVDSQRRAHLKANHSATHLLQAALKRVLGNHVTQKGSLVAADRLRFDFTHAQPLTPDEWARVEREVVIQIQHNTPVITTVTSVEQALAQGATALFGEKYQNDVRLLAMGTEDLGQDSHLQQMDHEDASQKSLHRPYSLELCGGTHVEYTGQIGFFRLIAQSSVSSGVRRLEALTGMAAWQSYFEAAHHLDEVCAVLKVSTEEVVAKVHQREKERRSLKKAMEASPVSQKESAPKSGDMDTKESWTDKAIPIGSSYVLCEYDPTLSPKALKERIDHYKQKIKTGVIALATDQGGRLSLCVGVTNDLVPVLDAVHLLREASEPLGSPPGGGRPDLAQTGGGDLSRLSLAFEKIHHRVQEAKG